MVLNHNVSQTIITMLSKDKVTELFCISETWIIKKTLSKCLSEQNENNDILR